jgi:4-oxalocrotonate tautomerase
MKKERGKIMDKRLSRRGFLKKSAIALSTVVVCGLTGIVGTGRRNAFKALASEGLKENNMSHVSVKLWPGRSAQTKQQLADAIVEDVVNIIGCEEESVSVSIEEVSSGDWKKKVYDPEIRGNMKNIYKKPGYSM